MMATPLSPRLRSRLRRLGVLTLVVIGLVVLQPFLWPLVQQVAVRFRESRSVSRQVTEIGQRVDTLQQDQSEQRALLEQLTAVVPASGDVLRVLGRLEDIAEQLGMTVEVKHIVEETPAAGDTRQSDLLRTGATTNFPDAGTDQLSPGVSASALSGTAPMLNRAQLLPLTVTILTVAPAETLLAYINAVEHIAELTQVASLNISPLTVVGPQADRGFYQLEMEIIFYVQQ